ncbi:MAG: hypothetical protein IPN13_07695 [Bacteroidetes bacterium]|nr:hypothetical protein [Bacteroidota bacterium]MBK7389052.1 hypothetical protein [Bacteroidota bacterium]MBK7969335.1 hypothetical protein [Bacteroidota bacterium]MBK8415431.1 hypothetical protein [Bacteroidota bacterium]MBK8873795.1 hypothetical protein [Bacteroidota bacterium]
MKIKLFLLAFLAFGTYSVNAQNKLCSEIYAANLFNVYVFSEQTGHDLTTLMGEQVNPALVNIIYIKTTEQKAEVDKNCKMGKMEGSVLIFPDADPSKTRRFCTATDYVMAIRSEGDMNIQPSVK